MSYTQYQQYGGNPYSNGPDAEAGTIGGPAHGQQDGLGHEMSATSNYSQPGLSASQQHTSTVLSQKDFLERINLVKAEIRNLSSSIHEISALHQRSLSSTDTRSSAELEHLVSQTQLNNTRIRDQIKFLEQDAAKTQDGSKATKNVQSKQLKADFEKNLKDYQQEEVNYRQRYREQIARQYRIVNPDASEQEVQEASELDWGSEGVFQTALKSNRSGQASSVLGAVRARHNELKRIEETLTDLANLFADLAQVVEIQNPLVERADDNAMKTVDDVRRANTELEKSNEHARRRRKLQCWGFLVVVLIILAVALGVGLGVGLAKSASSKV